MALAVAAIAAGAAGVTAVHALSMEMQSKLRGEAREFIAADILVQLRDPLMAEEEALLRPLVDQGGQYTTVIGTYGMVISAQVPDASLALVSVVDPSLYPLYGSVGLEPPQPLDRALQPDTVLLSPGLLTALKVRPGDNIRIARKEFRVAGAITSRPDWEIGVSTFLPQAMISYAGYERSGLAQQGLEADYRLLFRLGRNELAPTLDLLARVFPDTDVFDYRDPRPGAARALDAAAGFLGAAAILALIAGSVAAGLILHLHIEKRLDSACIMKALGARNTRVLSVYLIETGMLAIAGGLLASATGAAVTAGLARLAEGYVPLGLTGRWHWMYALEAMALAVAAALPAAVGPMLHLRATSPLAALRRRVDHPLPLPRLEFGFLPVPLRIGARNLQRPGNHAGVILAALAAGSAMLSATYIAQSRVSEEVAESVPATGANLYVIGAGQGQIEEASAWLRNQSAIERELQAFPLVWLHLSMRNETKLGAAAGEWLATCSNSAPAGSVILSRQAAAIGAKPGDRLEFHGRGKTVSARVAAGQINYLDEAIATLTFHCSAFEGIRTFYHAAIRVRPGEEDSVRRTLAARYPLLPTLSRAELAGFVQRLADHATAMARMISWQVQAIGCGLQLLLVAAAKRMRLGEAAVMKALGASPARVAATFCFEHGALGMTAGLAGGIAGAALASLLLSLLFHRVTIAVDVATILGSGAVTGLLAAVSGGLGSWSLLRSRPFELLRED